MEKLVIDIKDYLSEDEIKQILIEQVKININSLFKNEENTQRLLSNLSYEIVFNEIDKLVPNSRQVILDKTEKIIRDIKSYSVFRDGSYGSKPSLAYVMMEDAVKSNKDLINEKVKDTIINKDYSSEIWNTFEELAENFMSNIYEITRLGREKNKTTV